MNIAFHNHRVILEVIRGVNPDSIRMNGNRIEWDSGGACAPFLILPDNIYVRPEMSAEEVIEHDITDQLHVDYRQMYMELLERVKRLEAHGEE